MEIDRSALMIHLLSWPVSGLAHVYHDVGGSVHSIEDHTGEKLCVDFPACVMVRGGVRRIKVLSQARLNTPAQFVKAARHGLCEFPPVVFVLMYIQVLEGRQCTLFGKCERRISVCDFNRTTSYYW